MNEFIRGNNTIAGASGTLFIGNERVMEVKKIEAKITANRTDVQIGMSVDSKITGLKGEGTLEVNKVYSRSAEILNTWNKGKDKRTRLVIVLRDKDSVGNQEERVSIDNVWFNDLPITSFTMGEAVGESFTFGFTPEDVEFESKIK